MKRLIRIIFYVYKLPVFAIGYTGDRKKKILMDACRWLNKNTWGVGMLDVFDLLLKNKNFASVYNYRFKDNVVLYKIKKIIFKDNWNIELNTDDIGGGIMVLHHLGAVISAEKIGENCTISQGVTIGFRGGNRYDGTRDKPIIGDNVRIGTNSVVIGGIDIGNNVVIGAGSLILKSVDDNTVVAGNPQKVLTKH